MSQPDSQDTREGIDADDERHAAEAVEAEAHEQDASHESGDVPPSRSVEPPSAEPHAREKVDILAVAKRLQREGYWNEALKLELFKQAKKLPKEERQQWVYSELDRMYPPVQQNPRELRSYGDKTDTVSVSPPDSGQIRGLGKIPEGWPDLPANASLASEIGWVQANRLRVVTEKPGKATQVDLGQAISPAPSHAALGWLETSIRSYAKYVDVAAKVSGSGDDESAVMRAERKSIDEVRALLDEMRQEPFICPHCGKVIE